MAGHQPGSSAALLACGLGNSFMPCPHTPDQEGVETPLAGCEDRGDRLLTPGRRGGLAADSAARSEDLSHLLQGLPRLTRGGRTSTPTSWTGFPGGSVSKEAACSAGDLGSVPGLGRSPGEGNGNLLSIPAWEIAWTEEPGGLEPTGLQRAGHD